MPRKRTTASYAARRRLRLLAIPAAFLLAFLGVAVFLGVAAFLGFTALRVHRTLLRAGQSMEQRNQLPFTLRLLDSAAARTAFEPVASTPSYTTGALFAGQLYLAGASGLTAFDASGAPRTTLRTGIELPAAPITALLQARIRGTSEPLLVASTAGAGLLLVDPSPHAAPLIRQLLPAEVEDRDLTAILPLATGDLLLGTRQRGVLVYNGATLSPLPAFDSSKLQITALAAVDSSSFLIGTRNAGVFFIHAGIVDHADSSNGLPDNQVEAIAVYESHAYVGTPTGTASFDLSAPSFRPARILAEGLFAHTLSADADTLTIGTLDQGIQQVPLGIHARLYRASISVNQPMQGHQRVDAILPTPGSLYALADGILLRHAGGAWTPALVPRATTLTDRNISALAFAPDGTLYVGFFDRGLDELRPDSTIRHLEDDHLFCVNRLALDPGRQTIAAATADGLVLFDAQGTPRQILTRRDGLISDHITDVVFTQAGTALATPAGITFVNPVSTDSLYAFQGLVNNHVYALAATGPNQLLAGTLGGISILQAQSVQRNLTVTNSGLKHNWITALLQTPAGETLIGTYGAGLETLNAAGQVSIVALPAGTPKDLIINPNALYATPTHLYAGTLAHGLLVYSNATGRWTVITEGLPSRNITAFAARAGVLSIGTENGLVQIPEASLP